MPIADFSKLTKIEQNYTMDSMDQLARLMSLENITVQHRVGDKTAAFDTKNRVLYLPVWQETLPYPVYVLFISHEIGHALYTPDTKGEAFQNWLTQHSGGDEKLKNILFGYFNVTEDARIEKMVKELYPGTRKFFHEGYQELLDRDFFGIMNKDVNTLNLVDKINIHCKVDYLVSIDFSMLEQPFVERADNLQTYEDALQLALDLYEFDKANPTNNNNQSEEDDCPVEFPITQFRFEYKRETLVDENAIEHQYYNVPNISLEKINDSKIVVDYAEVHKTISDYANFTGTQGNSTPAREIYNKFKVSSRSVVDYLISQFEMKKAATAYSKSKISVTGKINVNKLHSYKFNNDIFHRSTVVPKGKSHGMMVLVDWSGSMESNMVGTLDQMLNLIFFCKKTNIPFVIYAFTNVYNKKHAASHYTDMVNNGDLAPGCMNLLTLFSSDIKGQDYDKCLLNLFYLRNAFMHSDFSGNRHLPERLKLGGTPLNTAIMVLPEIVKAFQKKSRVEVMNVVFITDGDSDSVTSVKSDKQYGTEGIDYSRNVIVFRDKKTNTMHHVNDYGMDVSNTVTCALLKLLKMKTGANIIGFYLTSDEITNIKYILASKMGGMYINDDAFQTVLRDLVAEFDAKKYAIIENSGYDHYYVITGGQGLMVDTQPGVYASHDFAEDEVEREYLSSISQMITSRIVLNKFIEKISS